MKMGRRILSCMLAFAMVLSCVGINAYAAPTDDLTTDNFSLDISQSDSTLTVALVCNKAVTGWGAGGGKMSVADANGADAGSHFTLTTVSSNIGDKNDSVQNAEWSSTANNTNGGDSLSAGTWATYTYTVSDSVPDGDYIFTMQFSDGDNYDGTDDMNDYSISGQSVTATYTVGSDPAPEVTDPYTANISTTATEFKVNDPVAVTVNVGGTVGSFASSEVTLTYDSTYLTFNQDASTMNGAGVDLTTAGTIKLVDHGETNAYPAAYVLNFTAAKATDDATTAVTLTDARFSTAENAISSDLIEATGENALSLTIKNADLNVTLPDSGVVTGNNTVPYGDDYTFTAKNNTTYMYYDYEVSATMGGSDVSAENIVNNGNGTWTVKNVTGNLVISVTETPKTYTVTVKGDSTVTAEEIAKVTTTGVTGGYAAYMTGVTYTLPAGQTATDTVDGWHYTATVTVNNASYTATANDLTYSIAGADVKGEIVITLSKVIDPAASVKVTINGSNEIQKDGQNVTEFTATKNSQVTLTLVPETGYSYVISDGTNNLTINDDNTFTVTVGNTPVTITVTKTLDTDSVAVQQYIQLDGTVMWLVTVNGNGTTEISGKTYSYNGNNMFWSSKYQAYCYLDVAATLSVADAKAKIGVTLVAADAVDVEYNMDVNNTSGKVDANDAQLVYNMYQTKAYDNFDTVDVIKFLEADLNDTVGVNTEDAQVIINKLLNING